MISYETINNRLGFDFMEKWKEYMDSVSITEDDDMEKCPLRLLTWEERDFVENDFIEKYSN